MTNVRFGNHDAFFDFVCTCIDSAHIMWYNINAIKTKERI